MAAIVDMIIADAGRRYTAALIANLMLATDAEVAQFVCDRYDYFYPGYMPGWVVPIIRIMGIAPPEGVEWINEFEEMYRGRRAPKLLQPAPRLSPAEAALAIAAVSAAWPLTRDYCAFEDRPGYPGRPEHVMTISGHHVEWCPECGWETQYKAAEEDARQHPSARRMLAGSIENTWVNVGGGYKVKMYTRDGRGPRHEPIAWCAGLFRGGKFIRPVRHPKYGLRMPGPLELAEAIATARLSTQEERKW